METTLKIRKEEVHGKVPVTVLHLSGWLDGQGEGPLLAEARDAYEAGSRYILLDLAEVDTLTRDGFREVYHTSPSSSPRRDRITEPVHHPTDGTPHVVHVDRS